MRKEVKKLILVMITFSLSNSFAAINKIEKIKLKTEVITDYCDGWDEGYCEGWKDVKGQYAICPIIPICPIAKTECSEGYKCGYNRGFKEGMKAARSE